MIDDLCHEIVEYVLSRVPLKSRARLKCVCKAWGRLISHLPRSLPPPTASGLVLFLRHTTATGADAPMTSFSHETGLISVADQGGACVLRRSLRHALPCSLQDSRGGSLLFSSPDATVGRLTYSLYRPSSEDWVPIPGGHECSRAATAALLCDASNTRQFKVICLFWDEVDTEAGTITYQTFSSRTCEWRQKRATLENSCLLLDPSFQRGEMFLPSLLHEGRLYWLWSMFITVYDDIEETFQLMEPPRKSDGKYPPYRWGLLWESEGKLHYCNSYAEELLIWVQSAALDIDRGSGGWSMQRRVRFIELNVGLLREVGEQLRLDLGRGRPRGVKWSTVRPCAFNQDLQVLFLQLPGVVLAYSFETGEMCKAWKFGLPGHGHQHCNIYSFQFCDL